MITALFIALNWLLAPAPICAWRAIVSGGCLCSSRLELSHGPMELLLPGVWAGLCLGLRSPTPCPQAQQLAQDWAPQARSSFSCLYFHSISAGDIPVGAFGSERLYVPNAAGVVDSGHMGRAVSLLHFQTQPIFSGGSQHWDSLVEL